MRQPPAAVIRARHSEPQRIAKLLARAGIASRREVERMIADRRIAIDGKPVETPATLLNSLKGVTVDDKPVKQPAPARLFIFHKPPGVLTAANDPKGRPTIYNRSDEHTSELQPLMRTSYDVVCLQKNNPTLNMQPQ